MALLAVGLVMSTTLLLLEITSLPLRVLFETVSVVVMGLGRFGKSLALELVAEGVEVLGIDNDAKVVQSLAGRLTHVVESDTTNVEAMRQLSVHEFDRAVIGIGTNLESSILSASVLLELGVPHIWAKAVTVPWWRTGT